MVGLEQLKALASVEAAPAISIYMPTHEKGREIRQDPIRLKNALAAVTQQLENAGHRRADIDQWLEQGRQLVADEYFWRHQSQGLILFAAPGFFQTHRLPISVEELQVVSSRFHLRPLLPLLADDGRFYCVTATAAETRLFEGSRFGLSELDIPLPQSVMEVAERTEYEHTRHASPPARPRQGSPVSMASSQVFGEAPDEQRKTQLVEHLRQVANALEQVLGGSRAPLVLVATPEIKGHLQELAKNLSLQTLLPTRAQWRPRSCINALMRSYSRCSLKHAHRRWKG